jgi:2-phospho-L-lactate guanylyltransferase
VTCCAIIPIKAPDLCKTRLRDALSDEHRRALVETMLRHVVETVQSARNIDKTILLGPRHGALSPSLLALPDPGLGLNAALRSAMQAMDEGVGRLVIVAADLPHVTQADIEALAGVADDAAAIAPDRAGAGTNALSLPLAIARDFRFQFGPGSFALHCAEIERLSLALRIVRTDSLALDIDEPADLQAAGWVAPSEDPKDIASSPQATP